MKTKAQIEAQQVPIRRGNFERHVAECPDCQPAREGAANIGPNDMCMSGMIMFRNYMIAIRNANPVTVENEEI